MGKLRPILFSNPRSAAVDVVQNYEYNIIDAPPDETRSEIIPPRNWQFPDVDEWDEVYHDQTRPDWFPFLGREAKMYHSRARPVAFRRYTQRPGSNFVTNTGLHLYYIEGTGGKKFLDYKDRFFIPL